MVSEVQMPLYPDVGDNGQWDVGVGIRNLDKGPAASPVDDTVPLAQATPADRAPTISSGYFQGCNRGGTIVQRWSCSHGSPGVPADHTGDTSSLGQSYQCPVLIPVNSFFEQCCS